MKTRLSLLLSSLVLVCLTPLLPAKETEPAPDDASVRPGINESYLDPELKVDDFLKRFEVESREVFQQRNHVVQAIGIRKGMAIADIGAGTGLYTRLFAEATGPQGWVHAVEISAPFLKHIVERARQEKHGNISAVLCPEDSVSLPPDSIDLAFICDVYHHFEYPRRTMQSLHRALKKGGTVVVIDFERIEGKSSDWVMGHVRAGKEVFRKEIEESGFKFVEEVSIERFKENYFMRFSKDS